VGQLLYWGVKVDEGVGSGAGSRIWGNAIIHDTRNVSDIAWKGDLLMYIIHAAISEIVR
jgi:hypothetical protein